MMGSYTLSYFLQLEEDERKTIRIWMTTRRRGAGGRGELGWWRGGRNSQEPASLPSVFIELAGIYWPFSIEYTLFYHFLPFSEGSRPFHGVSFVLPAIISTGNRPFILEERKERKLARSPERFLLASVSLPPFWRITVVRKGAEAIEEGLLPNFSLERTRGSIFTVTANF